MPLAFENLDGDTRRLMLEEIDLDIEQQTLYIAENRLTEKGKADYPGLLRTSAEGHDDGWLANQLHAPGMMNSHQDRKNRNGTISRVKVPYNAHETLAEGEFNKYYVRALCRRAMSDKELRLVVYRAKQVENPRPESEAKIGTTVNPQVVLETLRTNVPWETTIGLVQPNSGLTVRLVRTVPAAAQ